ncbi:CCAAT/enhancer-binding protein zeta-like [Aphidius gifuensis]|uniref:CCAAT/enhancer-binding protein zeta-like n=1 Tax=Aphidius gifuensis TaxID=684658 RepID=UPI001CDC41BC|nr:CCAAT/enhancer-binding protein zeta-like [Aphidius gifuensis]
MDESTSTKKWYEEFPKESAPCKHKKTEIEVLDLKAEAKKNLEGETAAYQLKQSKIRNSELDWFRTASAKGTGKTKVSANIVLIQDNPKYTLSRIIALVSQVKVSKQNQTTDLTNELRDLFIGDLLHPEYKLLKFEEQNLDKIPGANDPAQFTTDIPRKRLLSHWYFEDQLREQYEKFLTNLSSIASDTVDVNREKAISIMTDLLIANSEQEQKLLEFIINKVGDPKSKVASKAVCCLNKLLHEHPAMKVVVLKEIEKLLFRPNIGQRAQYYAICLLAQYVLDKDDSECSTTLIDLYFAFFKACLKKGEPDSRMMAAILTGVNRAYRFANLNTIKLNEHIDSVYKVVHVGSFNVSLNALSLLHQVVGNNPEQENRFYTAFYRKLFDPQIALAQKKAVFLNLLYRVMMKDQNLSRVFAFIKRVLQVSTYYPANMTCAVLYIVSQVIQARKDLKQIMAKGHIVIKKEKPEDDNDNDDEKKKEDQDDEDEDDIELITNNIGKNIKPENTIMLSNVITNSDGNKLEDPDKKDVVKIEEDNSPYYDPFVINPLKSGSMKAPAAELACLFRYFHPSVVLFASKIIEGQRIDYSGDPLEDLTTMRFLDRYVFKNPKKINDKNIDNTNDPLATRSKYAPKGLRSIPIDSNTYLSEDERKIPVDELYLYKYLKTKNNDKKIIKKEDDDDDDDDDNSSVNSDDFNEMMDKLSGSKDFDELDIAADIGTLKNKKKKSKNIDDDDEDDDGLINDEDMAAVGDDDEEDLDDMGDMEFDDSDNENELSDGLIDDEDIAAVADDDDDLGLDEIDDDASDMEFFDNFDDDDDDNKPKKSSNIFGKFKKSGKKGDIDSNVFVAAEEFAEMLEKQGRVKGHGKQGSSHAFSDADGASAKQLDWEIGRNQKIEGKKYGKKRPFGNKSGFKGNKNSKKFKRRN